MDPSANSDANSTEEDEKSDNNFVEIQHRLAADDDKSIDVALRMIAGLMPSELSQSVSLKCTQIRALIIAQKYDAALSTATNLLR